MGDTAAALVIGAFAAMATALTVSMAESDVKPNIVVLKPWDDSKYRLDNGKLISPSDKKKLDKSKKAWDEAFELMKSEVFEVKKPRKELKKFYEGVRPLLQEAVSGFNAADEYYTVEDGDIPKLMRSANAMLAHVKYKIENLSGWGGKGTGHFNDEVYTEDPLLHGEHVDPQILEANTIIKKPPTSIVRAALEDVKNIKSARDTIKDIVADKLKLASLEFNKSKHILLALHSQLYYLPRALKFKATIAKDGQLLNDKKVEKDAKEYEAIVKKLVITEDAFIKERKAALTWAKYLWGEMDNVHVLSKDERDKSKHLSEKHVKAGKEVEKRLKALIPNFKENRTETLQKFQEWTTSTLRAKLEDHRADEKVGAVLQAEFPESVEYCASKSEVLESFLSRFVQNMNHWLSENECRDLLETVADHTLNKPRIKTFVDTPPYMDDVDKLLKGLPEMPDEDAVAIKKKYLRAWLRSEAQKLEFTPRVMFSGNRVDAAKLVEEYVNIRGQWPSYNTFTTHFKTKLVHFIADNEGESWNAGVEDMFRQTVAKSTREGQCIFHTSPADKIKLVLSKLDVPLSEAIDAEAKHPLFLLCSSAKSGLNVSEVEKFMDKELKQPINYKKAFEILAPVPRRVLRMGNKKEKTAYIDAFFKVQEKRLLNFKESVRYLNKFFVDEFANVLKRGDLVDRLEGLTILNLQMKDVIKNIQINGAFVEMCKENADAFNKQKKMHVPERKVGAWDYVNVLFLNDVEKLYDVVRKKYKGYSLLKRMRNNLQH